MMPERQISIAAIMVAGAIIIPEAALLLKDPSHAPGMVLAAGGFIGAVGTLLGSFFADAQSSKGARLFLLAVVMCLGIAMSLGVGLGALREPGEVRKIVLFVAALLPVIGPVIITVQVLREKQ